MLGLLTDVATSSLKDSPERRLHTGTRVDHSRSVARKCRPCGPERLRGHRETAILECSDPSVFEHGAVRIVRGRKSLDEAQKTHPMTDTQLPERLRQNRFARYPKTTLAITVLVLLALIEAASYVVILVKGHQNLRFQYRYNRILSGYTVFQNVPNHSFRTSAIKADPAEPDPVLDEHGFLSDGPVSRAKPKGTFRIFLVGGSTAFGAGQNTRYHDVHAYPDGLYAYPSSIAGRLKAELQKGNPQTKYEVINAAGFERRIHQSFLQYLESLSQYEPDLIINLEGMNDVYSVASGTPFADVAQHLPFYADLYEKPNSLLNYSATYYVLSTAYEKWINRRRSAEPAPTEAAPAAAGDSRALTQKSGGAVGRDAYEKNKSRYEHNAERLLQILRQYFAVVKTDKQRTLFVLQPLLGRTKVNKQLSETERKFAAVMVPAAADSRTPIDENALLLAYFYDDFLSAAFQKTAEGFGVPYVDMNREIAGLGPDVEFYTDYCHLTPQGNQRVAEILARKILGK
jgi:lysophospholipase L1-like esterase